MDKPYAAVVTRDCDRFTPAGTHVLVQYVGEVARVRLAGGRSRLIPLDALRPLGDGEAERERCAKIADAERIEALERSLVEREARERRMQEALCAQALTVADGEDCWCSEEGPPTRDGLRTHLAHCLRTRAALAILPPRAALDAALARARAETAAGLMIPEAAVGAPSTRLREQMERKADEIAPGWQEVRRVD